MNKRQKNILWEYNEVLNHQLGLGCLMSKSMLMVVLKGILFSVSLVGTVKMTEQGSTTIKNLQIPKISS